MLLFIHIVIFALIITVPSAESEVSERLHTRVSLRATDARTFRKLSEWDVGRAASELSAFSPVSDWVPRGQLLAGPECNSPIGPRSVAARAQAAPGERAATVPAV